MASVGVTTNFKDVQKWLTNVERNKLPRIMSQSVNETARGVRTDLAASISSESSLKKGGLSPTKGLLAVSKKASRLKPEAVISGSRQTSSFDKFKNKPVFVKRTNGVKVTVKGKRKIIRRARIIDGKVKAPGIYRGGSFKFDGRRTFKTLKGLSVGSQFEQPYVKGSLNAIVDRRFTKSFERIAKRQLGLR